MALLSQLSDYVPLIYDEAPIPPERLRLLIPNDQDFSFIHTFVEEDTKSLTATVKVHDDMLVRKHTLSLLTKQQSSNPTTLTADIWEKVFSYFNPSTLYQVMNVCTFFHGVSLRESLWSRFWLNAYGPAPRNPLAPSWKMQFKYFSDVIVKTGSIFVAHVEVLLILAGTELHIFDLPEGKETPIAKKLASGFASLKSMKRITKIATPSRTVPLHNTILIHQQIQALESVKRFGFKFPDEEEIWFAIPKQQLQRSKNWLKVLYFYSKQLKKDLNLED